MPRNQRDKMLKNIQMVFFDFDGVFTNNQVIVSQNGEESILCNRSDGLGLDMLRKLKIQMAIISTEPNPVVKMRANKLRIDCYNNCVDKLKVLKKIILKKGIPIKNVVYMGNDINDLACLKAVGIPVAVADAYPEVKKVSLLVLKRKGGYGAVREFCEIIREIKINIIK